LYSSNVFLFELVLFKLKRDFWSRKRISPQESEELIRSLKDHVNLSYESEATIAALRIVGRVLVFLNPPDKIPAVRGDYGPAFLMCFPNNALISADRRRPQRSPTGCAASCNLADCDLIFGPIVKLGGPGRLKNIVSG
jgi:hypothetical protein